jgi:hypothetical protein
LDAGVDCADVCVSNARSAAALAKAAIATVAIEKRPRMMISFALQVILSCFPLRVRSYHCNVRRETSVSCVPEPAAVYPQERARREMENLS